MKVTFIMPCVGRSPGRRYPRSWLMEPLALAQLAGMTPPDWERAFHDDRMEAIPYEVPTDLAAINVETYTARRAYEIAREFRRRGVPVIMGGFHATLMPDEVAAHADAVLVGEAEAVWPGVLADARAGRLKPRYAASGQPALNGLFPDRRIYAGRRYTRISLVETARGCPCGCEFCSISAFYRRTFRARPVGEVVEEVRRLGSRHVFFVDDNLAVEPDRTRELLDALIPLRIRWAGQVSLDAGRDLALLRLMRKSGCMGVLIGFESLEAGSLKAMGKGANLAERDYAGIVRNFRDNAISIYATFVFGYDHDTEASFERTLRFALEQKFFFTAFNHLVPFPGTPLYARLGEEGRLLYDAWWLDPRYRFGDIAFRPARLSADELGRLCAEYRRRFYSLSSIARRGLDVRANCRNAFMTLLYLAQNLASRREIAERQGLPLGIQQEA